MQIKFEIRTDTYTVSIDQNETGTALYLRNANAPLDKDTQIDVTIEMAKMIVDALTGYLHSATT